MDLTARSWHQPVFKNILEFIVTHPITPMYMTLLHFTFIQKQWRQIQNTTLPPYRKPF